jgi:hypothetical protein
MRGQRDRRSIQRAQTGDLRSGAGGMRRVCAPQAAGLMLYSWPAVIAVPSPHRSHVLSFHSSASVPVGTPAVRVRHCNRELHLLCDRLEQCDRERFRQRGSCERQWWRLLLHASLAPLHSTRRSRIRHRVQTASTSATASITSSQSASATASSVSVRLHARACLRGCPLPRAPLPRSTAFCLGFLPLQTQSSSGSSTASSTASSTPSASEVRITASRDSRPPIAPQDPRCNGKSAAPSTIIRADGDFKPHKQQHAFRDDHGHQQLGE